MWRFAFNDQYGVVNLLLFGSHVTLYTAWLASPFWALSAIILADVWKTSAFAALIILAGLQSIPDELYEAAKIDGANSWQRFVGITLPLLKPAILVALLFRTMDAFRVFDLVFVMTQGGPGDATNVLQGRTRRSMPVASRMRLEISSIEHSVVSMHGIPWRANIASAARTSNCTCWREA